MNQTTQDFNQQLLQGLDASPTPFHAVSTMSARLRAAGYTELLEADAWDLQAGQAYFVTRNQSSLIAFIVGESDLLQNGVRMVGAHTDSPCLKVKPQPDLQRHGFHQLGVEVYGGVLLNPWFDRDLSIAGRVNFLDDEANLHSALVDFERAVATIPSLAIHLDRGVNDKRSINKQTDLPPVLGLISANKSESFKDILLQQMHRQHPQSKAAKVLDYELSFYDTQAAAQIGLNEEFIAAARLDNLLSCFTGLAALLEAGREQSAVFVCNDHEEVGSASAAGANGPFLRDVMLRICGSEERLIRTMQRSLMVSADNAHGVHPNFADRHDGNHGPRLNAGPVIKVNANQRYATNSQTAAMVKNLAGSAGVPLQQFVVRSDMGCGSTIGPITAAELGVPTLDIGAPTFGMHSIRELAGSNDAWHLYRLMLSLFNADNVNCDY